MGELVINDGYGNGEGGRRGWFTQGIWEAGEIGLEWLAGYWVVERSHATRQAKVLRRERERHILRHAR